MRNPLIYLDSSVLLDVITGQKVSKARRGARVLAAVAEGRARGVASWLVLAEVVSAPGPGVPPNIREHVTQILEHGQLLRWVEVERLISRDARLLGRRFPGVAGADAVHLATALRVHADYLLTTDLKFLRKLHGHDDTGPARVDHLTVQQPELVWDADIFESCEEEQDLDAEHQDDQGAPPARSQH